MQRILEGRGKLCTVGKLQWGLTKDYDRVEITRLGTEFVLIMLWVIISGFVSRDELHDRGLCSTPACPLDSWIIVGLNARFSLVKKESHTIGLSVLTGGEPQKKPVWSSPASSWINQFLLLETLISSSSRMHLEDKGGKIDDIRPYWKICQRNWDCYDLLVEQANGCETGSNNH